MSQALALLDGLRNVDDPRRRRMIALGVLTRALAPHGIEPVLVGGGALEFYTAGGYATSDVDLALPSGPEVDAAFAEMGFSKEGRYWVRDDLDLLFEAPAPAGLPGENASRTEVEVDGLRVVVIGIEDLLLDRLRAWVHWQSGEDERWARRLALLHADRIDWQYLRDRTKHLPEEVDAVAQLAEEGRQVIDYDDFQAEVRRRKRDRWAKILASEPPGRRPGRRPRDPEKERLLARLDRARLERENPELLRRRP